MVQVRVSQVEALRDRLVEQVFLPYYHVTVTAEALHELLARLHRELGVSTDVLYESLRSLAGKELTPTLALRTAWRLAGNKARLRQGQPVPPWTTQPYDEWAAMQVVGMRFYRTRGGVLGFLAKILLLTGLGCPQVVETFWSRRFIPVFARRLGFTSSRGRYPYQHPFQIVGLRFLGLVERDRSLQQPGFRKVRSTAGLIRWNREAVLDYRMRIKSCPRGYSHACHRCPVGWESCPGAVHRYDYVRQGCEQCGREAQVFDPEWGMDACMSCKVRASVSGE